MSYRVGKKTYMSLPQAYRAAEKIADADVAYNPILIYRYRRGILGSDIAGWVGRLGGKVQRYDATVRIPEPATSEPTS